MTPIFATGPAGFRVWKASDLRGYEKALSPKVNSNHSANEQLGEFDGYRLEIVHRDGTGRAESHANNSELLIVQTGEATLLVGGTLVNPTATGAGEKRGPSINGGEKVLLGPGDVVRIPGNTPHHMMVATGKQITYIDVKEPVN